MSTLLKLKTRGIKNLEKDITLEFANLTVEHGPKKINTVKGIFGYNGAGKSAIINSVDIYKNVITGFNYLLQDETRNKLNKLINIKANHFEITTVFYIDKNIIRHSLRIEKIPENLDFQITREEISLLQGRTLNDKYELLISKQGKDVQIGQNYVNDALSFIKNIDFSHSSLLSLILNDKISNETKLHDYLKQLVKSIENVDVYMDDFERLNDEEMIPIEKYDEYLKENSKLVKFIQIFKPELKTININPLEDRGMYHLRKSFVYDEYNVDLEFESSGIKQLVKLFAHLEACAKGKIVFIDEIDKNINPIFFKELISFYKNYGNGQLIFTSHSIESMNVLKDQSRAIAVLGNDNNLDTWIEKGNRSPINDYAAGMFPNSPMNIEDFDFINIFLGEDDD